MKHTATLTTTSLLSILFTNVHLADDYVRGMSKGDLGGLTVVFFSAIWLYAALVLVERRSGHVIILITALLASLLPVVHMIGKSGLTAGIKSAGGFFFTLNLLVLGATATFSVLLAIRGLWSLRGQAR